MFSASLHRYTPLNTIFLLMRAQTRAFHANGISRPRTRLAGNPRYTPASGSVGTLIENESKILANLSKNSQKLYELLFVDPMERNTTESRHFCARMYSNALKVIKKIFCYILNQSNITPFLQKKKYKISQ